MVLRFTIKGKLLDWMTPFSAYSLFWKASNRLQLHTCGLIAGIGRFAKFSNTDELRRFDQVDILFIYGLLM